MTTPDWNPTHKTPEKGLMARAKPDASLEPLQRIAHGVEVRIVDTSGGWSKIRTEQGWESWVDGTRLVEIDTPAATPPPPPPPPPPAPVASPVVETDPEPEPAPEPEAAPADWSPTHAAQEKGLPTRDEPNSKAKTTGRLEAGTELEIIDTDGLWAKVRNADGAKAWVNGRLLVATEKPGTPEIAAEPAPEAQTEPEAWAATHTVPDDGLPARAEPDASLDQLLRIQAGTGVRVIEASGAWSRIDIESGWEAWVDNRRLDPIGGAPAATSPEPDPEPEPEPTPTPEPEPEPAPEAWAATHTVPDDGLPARAKPDASLDQLLRIQAGTGVRVIETSGAWSRIDIESGWEAWVDNRRLDPIGGAPAATIPDPTPEPEPDSDPEPTPEPEPAPDTEPEPETETTPQAWAATHTIPDGGLPARAEPDASLDQLLRIQADTGVRVIEASGAWSRIDIESGWEAWVDNRRLDPIGGAPAATAPATTTPAAVAAPAPETEAWAATHTIPEGGLSAWAEPKADRQPILKVKGGTPVQVVDTAGAWSRIRTEPGWEAWVDGRRLAEPD